MVRNQKSRSTLNSRRRSSSRIGSQSRTGKLLPPPKIKK